MPTTAARKLLNEGVRICKRRGALATAEKKLERAIALDASLVGASWSPPTPMTSLNSASQDHGASPALGGSLIVFASGRGTGLNLYSAQAPDFVPAILDELSDDAYNKSDPEIMAARSTS